MRVCCVLFGVILVDGHLSVVQYLTEDPLRHEGGTTDAMDRAAANGHLECLQWLYFNRPEGCTTEAFDSAAANNQKEVAEWLREQAEIIRSSGSAVNANARLHGTARAIDLAAGNGHVDMVRWLHDNYHQHCRSTSVNTLNSPVSTSLGFLSPLYYHLNSSIYQSHGSAHESHDLSCEDSNVVQGNAGVLQQPQPTLPIPTRLAYDSAAGNGHLDVLKYLLENYENLLSVSTVELAARGGHVLVLQWMYENYADMFMPTYSDSDYGYFDGLHHSPSKPTTATGGVVATPAVRVGGGSGSANSRSSKRLKTVRESYDLTTAPVAEALSLAIRHGQCQAVRWLLTTLRMQPTESDIDWAARNGHLAMLLLLQEYCNSFADTIRPSLKSLEWSVLNGHIAVVQYLLRLRDNRLEARQDQMTSGGEERPVDFSAKQAAIYARRYGQDELLLLLDHYIPHVNRSTAESSTTSSFSSFTASPPSNIVPPLTHSVATTTADMGNLNDITSVLVHSPSLVLFSSSTE